MKFNVWHESLPAGKVFDETAPIPEAVYGGAREGTPIWVVDVTSLDMLIEIIDREGGEVTINTNFDDHPNPELVLP